MACDGDTTVGDLIGEYAQDPAGGFRFVYGPLVTAMAEGRALLLDDATLISPEVLAALYPAMGGRRQIRAKAHRGEPSHTPAHVQHAPPALTELDADLARREDDGGRPARPRPHEGELAGAVGKVIASQQFVTDHLNRIRQIHLRDGHAPPTSSWFTILG